MLVSGGVSKGSCAAQGAKRYGTISIVELKEVHLDMAGG